MIFLRGWVTEGQGKREAQLVLLPQSTPASSDFLQFRKTTKPYQHLLPWIPFQNIGHNNDKAMRESERLHGWLKTYGSLSEVKKMSGLGVRGNYLLIKLETDVPNPHNLRSWKCRKFRSQATKLSHTRDVRSSTGSKNGMMNFTQKGKKLKYVNLHTFETVLRRQHGHLRMGNRWSERKENVSCRWEGKSYPRRF